MNISAADSVQISKKGYLNLNWILIIMRFLIIWRYWTYGTLALMLFRARILYTINGISCYHAFKFPVIDIKNVEGAITIPIPFGDFQLLAGGEWIHPMGLKMKVKFTREHADSYSIKGYSIKGCYLLTRYS